MLIKLKRTRTHVEDRNLALCLATSAGLLNAMALAAFGFFPSHMSGNIAQISSDLNEMDIRNLKVFMFHCVQPGYVRKAPKSITDAAMRAVLAPEQTITS